MERMNFNPPKTKPKESFNEPLYLRSRLSRGQIRDHPEYEDLFKKCPSCDVYSLKPLGYKNMSPGFVRQNSSKLERRCGNCGYIHKPTKEEEEEE